VKIEKSEAEAAAHTKRIACNKKLRRGHFELKLEVFTRICGGVLGCMCPGCRTVYTGFLQVDHIDADGFRHLSAGKKKRRLHGPFLWRWIKRNNYPPGFAILCANCNSLGGKGSGDRCPMAGSIH
jgi:hypothetical protein